MALHEHKALFRNYNMTWEFHKKLRCDSIHLTLIASSPLQKANVER